MSAKVSRDSTDQKKVSRDSDSGSYVEVRENEFVKSTIN